jgi:excisionase family DNA binding protein
MLSLSLKRDNSRKGQYQDVLNYALIEQVVKNAIEKYGLDKIEQMIGKAVEKSVSAAVSESLSKRTPQSPRENFPAVVRPISTYHFKKKVDKKPVPFQSKEPFTLPEAARYLKIGESTFRKYLGEGKITGTKSGNKWSFSKAQLNQYSNEVKASRSVDANGAKESTDSNSAE